MNLWQYSGGEKDENFSIKVLKKINVTKFFKRHF